MYFTSFNLNKIVEYTFMIHSTDEETKAQKGVFIQWTNRPFLLDTFFVTGPDLSSGETIL